MTNDLGFRLTFHVGEKKIWDLFGRAASMSFNGTSLPTRGDLAATKDRSSGNDLLL